MVQIINSHQSWPSLQQTPLDKYQSTTANHRQRKPDMLSQDTSANPDYLCKHVKLGQAIPTCIAKDTVYKGLQEPRTGRIAETVRIAVGVRKAQIQKINITINYNTPGS